MPIHSNGRALNLYLRQGNITFSRNFINSLRNNGFILTRRDRFCRNGILVNHGNHNDINLGRRVNQFYLFNSPSYIRYCSNKRLTYDLLKKYSPKTYDNINAIDRIPIIAKPLNGHHGYGIVTLNTPQQIRDFYREHRSGYIYQEKISIRHEYRFNIFDNEIYQISHRELLPTRTLDGGYIFNYRSLGENAGISNEFYEFVYSIIDDIHKSLGNNLCHYTIDVMKGMNNKYYLTELNSACGIGDFTAQKLHNIISNKLGNGQLEKYRVR